MAGNKTKPADVDVDAFLDGVADEKRRRDCETVMAMMARITGEPATFWGSSLIGYGSYHYRYESGREGDSFLTGLSPRKSALTLYIMPGFSAVEDLMARLGKYKTGKSCLYIKKLEDVDLDVLESLISWSVNYMREKYTA